MGSASFGEGRGGLCVSWADARCWVGQVRQCFLLGGLNWELSRSVLAFLKAGVRLQHSDQVLVFMVSPPQGPSSLRLHGWGGVGGAELGSVLMLFQL